MDFEYTRRVSVVALLLGLALVSWRADAAPGDGVESSGGWELTPAVTLSGGYNSNLFRASPDETASTVVSAPLVLIEPSLSIASPKDRNFLLNLDAGVQWEQYIGSSVETTRGGSVDPKEQSGLTAHADIMAGINPKGNVGLTVDEHLARVNEPSPYAGNQSYNWITNTIGATVGIHPGAQILDVGLGYHWTTNAYETAALDYLDRDEHRFDLDARWRFLPKTALLAKADYSLIRWDDNIRPPVRRDTSAQPLTNVDSNPLRVQAGLAGLLTRRISLRGLVGYGWSMDAVGPSFSGVIGTAAVGFCFGRLDLDNSIDLGYRRNFRTATVGNFYSMHQVFANYKQSVLDNALGFRLGGRFEWRDYSQTLDFQNGSQSGDSLNDRLLIGEAGANVNIDDWLLFDLAYNIRANLTDDQYNLPAVDASDPSISILRKYTEHVITLSATFQY